MFEKECKSRYGTLAAISVILTVLLYTVSAMSVISNINRYIQILSGLGMGSLFSKENDFTFGADEEEPLTLAMTKSLLTSLKMNQHSSLKTIQTNPLVGWATL